MFAFDDKTRALLDATARLGSVSAAARALGLDPSNAHRHLRAAEARAGSRLVERSQGARSRLRLTRAGRARLASGGALVGRALAFASEEGTTPVRVGPRVVHVAGRLAPGPVALTLRPEDIVLRRAEREGRGRGTPSRSALASDPPSSARNAWPARVVRLREASEESLRGSVWLVDLAAGSVRLRALVTRGARRDLRLREGSSVVAVFKATAVSATSLA